jgi:hypothetical protein
MINDASVNNRSNAKSVGQLRPMMPDPDLGIWPACDRCIVGDEDCMANELRNYE